MGAVGHWQQRGHKWAIETYDGQLAGKDGVPLLYPTKQDAAHALRYHASVGATPALVGIVKVRIKYERL